MTTARPLRLFHGSRTRGIDALRASRGGEYGPGVYLTESEDTARFYARTVASGPDAPVIYVVDARIEKPFVTTKAAWLQATASRSRGTVQRALIKKGYDAIVSTELSGAGSQVIVFDPSKVAIVSSIPGRAAGRSSGAGAIYTYWHVTTKKAWAQIQKQGFRAGSGKCGDGLYLWDREHYAREHLERDVSEPSVMLAIQTREFIDDCTGDLDDEEREEFDDEGDPDYYEHVNVRRYGAKEVFWRPEKVKVVATWEPAGRSSGRTETWYHLTDRARFRLDPKYTPDDNAVALEDRSGVKGIYLAPDVHKWVAHGYLRPFLVELAVDPAVRKDKGVHGRYLGEMFVPASSFDKLEVQRVIPLDAFDREQWGGYGTIESDVGEAFDTGRPIAPVRGGPGMYPFHGYRYLGPDVREMDAATLARLKKAWRKALKARG